MPTDASCTRCFFKLHSDCNLCSAVLCCACKLTELHLSDRRQARRIAPAWQHTKVRDAAPRPWYKRIFLFRRLFA
jgi:hypothetical protein